MTPAVLYEELEALKAKDLYRELLVLERSRGERAHSALGKLVLFCGNDYLGLSQHPRVIEAFRRAAEVYGVGAGAARLISGTSPAHEQLETRLALIKKKERALLYSAGYLANLGTLTALADDRDLLVMDKLCHASIIDGARLSGATVRVFPHKNYARAEAILAKAAGFRRRLLVSETVFSMDGDLADLEALVRLKEKYDGLLIVDDAHGTGVLGETGQGAAEDLGLENKIDVIVGTLSKALGCLGGFAAASEEIVKYLINRSRPFMFATAMPPALCRAACEALRVLEEEPGIRQSLWRNTRRIHAGLRHAAFSVPEEPASPILPIVIGTEKDAVGFSKKLFEHGFFVPAIRPPTVPKGTSRLRLTVSASHAADDIDRLIQVLTQLRA